eukprot:g22626.t1
MICCDCMMWELVVPIVVHSDHICSKCWLLEEFQLRVDELENELRIRQHLREGAELLRFLQHHLLDPSTCLTGRHTFLSLTIDRVTWMLISEGSHTFYIEFE